MGDHIGRHWSAAYDKAQSNLLDKQPTIEEECPCPTEPCGLVDTDKIHPDCSQHTASAEKTMRSRHTREDCPGARA